MAVMNNPPNKERKISKPPGQNPVPDNQGKSNTCTRHAVSKAVTGGLHIGLFGIILDLCQEFVTNSLVQLGNNVGGCWPTDFDKTTILAKDKNSLEYYNVGIEVAKCTFKFLSSNMDRFKFVVVYQTPSGPHCVYVNKVENGKLCCMNSHGNKNPFPQLKPENVSAIYSVRANASKASTITNSGSQISLDKLSQQIYAMLEKKIEDEHKKKEDALKKRENELKKKEDELEDALKKKENELKKKEDELEKKESELKKRAEKKETGKVFSFINDWTEKAKDLKEKGKEKAKNWNWKNPFH